MGKEIEYKGNSYVDSTLNVNQISRDEMKKLLSFLESHECVYLYGSGKCGSGFMEYCKICGFLNVKNYITSDDINDFFERYTPGHDGVILTLKGDYYPQIMPNIWGKLDLSDIFFLTENTKTIFARTFSREYLNDNMWITLPLAKHCNVNCASCNMFSPLCEKEFYSLKDVKRDISKLSEINVHLSKLNITGGEPFLNPEIVDILETIRARFPLLRIEVFTNALLINKLSEEQLRKIKGISAIFRITDYDLNKKGIEKAYEIFDTYGINYQVNYDGDDKRFFKKIIDFSGNVPVYEYINCQYYTFCFAPILFNGVLYKCPMALNVDVINKSFNKNLECTDGDYLVLDKVTTPSQIHEFWRKRLPMCSYCPPVTDAVPWHISERKIEEWT